MRSSLRRVVEANIYRVLCGLAWLPNRLLARLRREVVFERSVLHISYLVHVPFYTTRILRRQGIRADYLAVGSGDPRVWQRCDFHIPYVANPFVRFGREWFGFWRIVAKYRVIHAHFGIMLSESGWELPLLQRMGRRIVVHYRGCDIRHQEANFRVAPLFNICADCDYDAACRQPSFGRRRDLSRRFGDCFLVTTPDLKDFIPEAHHLPLFIPDLPARRRSQSRQTARSNGRVKIVHVTVHPQIEGTARIRATIDRLRAKGFAIDFEFLSKVPHAQVIDTMAEADLTIGKMKMGYYANAQIESMALGVPAVTYVRPEFMTPALAESGFIFSDLERLEETLEYYLTHPDALDAKKQAARASIRRLHDNTALARTLIEHYEFERHAPTA